MRLFVRVCASVLGHQQHVGRRALEHNPPTRQALAPARWTDRPLCRCEHFCAGGRVISDDKYAVGLVNRATPLTTPPPPHRGNIKRVQRWRIHFLAATGAEKKSGPLRLCRSGASSILSRMHSGRDFAVFYYTFFSCLTLSFSVVFVVVIINGNFS